MIEIELPRTVAHHGFGRPGQVLPVEQNFPARDPDRRLG